MQNSFFAYSTSSKMMWEFSRVVGKVGEENEETYTNVFLLFCIHLLGIDSFILLLFSWFPFFFVFIFSWYSFYFLLI